MATPETPASRILVVDDDEMTLDFVELGLRYEGFDVTRAVDGHEALRQVERRRINRDTREVELDGRPIALTTRELGLTAGAEAPVARLDDGHAERPQLEAAS